jgi:hypothetical protein
MMFEDPQHIEADNARWVVSLILAIIAVGALVVIAWKI